MNHEKLRQLFAAARKETAPMPPEAFADSVLRAVRREPAAVSLPTVSLLYQLDRLFPRIAFAALGIIALCVGADFAFSAAGIMNLDDSLSCISAQWFFI